jgi:hypothetical protein
VCSLAVPVRLNLTIGPPDHLSQLQYCRVVKFSRLLEEASARAEGAF